MQFEEPSQDHLRVIKNYIKALDHESFLIRVKIKVYKLYFRFSNNILITRNSSNSNGALFER
jgi:hypothetical protein